MTPEQLIKLRPSAASRWFACPASAVVAAMPAEYTSNIYAATGTGMMGHIENALGELADESYFDDLVGRVDKIEGFDVCYTQEDADAGKVCFREISALEVAGYKIEIEVPVEARIGVDRILVKGRVDFLATSADKIIVIDYKHGVGIPVNAINNKQALTYLICTVEQRKTPKKSYEIRIIQPRAPLESGRDTKWEIPGGGLKGLADSASAAISRAVAVAKKLQGGAMIGMGDYEAGDHCKYCAIEHSCPARVNKAVSAACTSRMPFEGGRHVKTLLDNADEIRKTLKSAEDWADAQLLEGKPIFGYKLITCFGSRSVRKDLTEGEIEELKAAKLIRLEPKNPTINEIEKAGKKGIIKKPERFIAEGEKKPKRVQQHFVGPLWVCGTDDFETAETAPTEG